ncbi:RDD family protein [Bordetella avium]|uniref:RDD family protein n=1 Tax=Bordetella avium TaxID=521 RepID=UPI000E68C992|nr:RDD family protein [Bordetella avium]RIQ73124.1 RDD family protein [Bordetella avium]
MNAPTPSRARRFACMLYEGVLLFGVVFLANTLFDTLTQSRHGLALRHARQAWLFLVIGLYFVLCWRQQGQTLPMQTWKIRLLTRSGSVPGTTTLVLRYLLLWPLPLATAGLIALMARLSGWPALDLLIAVAPFSLFVYTWTDRDGQFLHDHLLGTRLLGPP